MKLRLLFLQFTSNIALAALVLNVHLEDSLKDHAVDTESEIDALVLRNAFEGNYNILIPQSNQVISNIRYDKQDSHIPKKRVCEAAYYEQYQILDSGDEVTSWEPASICMYCSMNQGGECSMDMPIRIKTDISITSGEFLAMRSNSTQKLSRSYKGPNSLYCDIYGFENVTQVHYQLTKRWAQMRKRTCVSACGTICTDWSDEYLTEAIVTEQTKVQCFKGYENVKCDS